MKYLHFRWEDVYGHAIVRQLSLSVYSGVPNSEVSTAERAFDDIRAISKWAILIFNHDSMLSIKILMASDHDLCFRLHGASLYRVVSIRRLS